MYEVRGDFKVLRTLEVGRRANQGLRAATITAAEVLDKHSAWWQYLTATAGQDTILPDATTLSIGWQVNIHAAGAGALAVKTYHATTPVLLRAVESGRAYAFTLVDNSTSAGVWHCNFLEESDSLPSERYTEAFDIAGWGAPAGGYYYFSIIAATHGRGVNPAAQIFMASGSDFVKIDVDEVKISSTGNIGLRIPEVPDGRFDGKVVII